MGLNPAGITFKRSKQNLNTDGSVAQLNRASDYGSEGCGFESRRNHEHKEDPEMKTCFQSRVLFYVCKISPWQGQGSTKSIRRNHKGDEAKKGLIFFCS